MTPEAPTSVSRMASKKTTNKKPAQKKPAKKADSKAQSKKTPAKKAASQKSSSKKPAAKKAAASKSSSSKPRVNMNTSVKNGAVTYTATTSNPVAADITVTMTTPPQVQELAKTVTNTLVQMNDIKNKSLRKRMLAWFKRS